MKISFGYFKIAFLLLITVSLNVFSMRDDSVSIFTATEDEAVRVALVKARQFLSEKPALCFTEIIYDCLNEDQVNYFIVVISNEKAKMDKIQAYEVFGNIQKYEEIKSQVITVFVNSDKTREPIIAVKEGLPPYINDHPIFSKLYSINGDYYYIKQDTDFINLYTHQNEGTQPITVPDLDDMDEIQIINEDNFINKGWDESVLMQEPTKLGSLFPNYIYYYKAPPLSWTQKEITANLGCYTTGCCYIAATSSILAYYDDYPYNNKGPFEYLVPSGHGYQKTYVIELAKALYRIIVKADNAGERRGMTEWTNTKNGYSFIYDYSMSPSIDKVKTEISNDRPFLYSMHRKNSLGEVKGHLVVAVGYKQTETRSGTAYDVIAYSNQSDKSLTYYNWNEPLSKDLIMISPNYANMKISYPNSSSVWVKGSTGKISWSGFSGSSYVKIEFIYPTGKIVVIKSTATTTSSQGSLDWTVDKSLTSNTGYKVRITSTQYPYTQSLTSASFRIK